MNNIKTFNELNEGLFSKDSYLNSSLFKFRNAKVQIKFEPTYISVDWLNDFKSLHEKISYDNIKTLDDIIKRILEEIEKQK